MIKKKEFLFEICWEVCNKVGGIYTVINSKLFEVQKNFENYYLMGIYQEKNSEFIEEKIPKVYEIAYGNLLKKGIKIHFGKWNLKNRPNVILVEHLGYSSNINEIKSCLWEKYYIDSLNSNWYDFDEAILWSWVCGIAIKELSNFIDEKIIVHSHEWMSGGAIFYLKTLNSEQIKTIFTTHATMLGRAMSGNGQDIYSNMENIDAEKKAYELNIQTKYHTEKALANISDVFTTVSHITGKEAEFFYKKKPDILLFNGFDVNHRNLDYYYHSFKKSRYLINEFIESYFYNYYNLNLDNSLIFYTSGRYEIKNKGIDLMIDSLGKINEKLKEIESDKTIISFFLIPFGNFEKDENIQESRSAFKMRKEKIQNNFAPLSTHKIPTDNEIIDKFFKNALLNRETDKVKVIFLPIYLNENDSFLNMTYYDVISGMDLGIFPSNYEPWGYTPLESIAHAVPAITSDLAGFGRYCFKEECCNAVKSLKRENKPYDESKEELINIFETYLNLNEKEILDLKEKALKYSKEFSWEEFYDNYLKAYDLALKK